MAKNSQNESKLPLSKYEKRESADLLPRFYRTESNKKFLQSTIDQLIQPGTVKKINGYIGRQSAKSATAADIFLTAADKERQDYQLEPAAVIQDYLGNTLFYKDYVDHINHVDVFGGNVSNMERVDRQEFYSWNPHVCWDKFVNFQQYYWLPYGPPAINIPGQQREIVSTYTVKTVDEGDNYAFVFTPNGMTRNPSLTLYRGQTYHFEITAKDNPFSFKTVRSTGDLDRYKEGVSAWAVENGTITFTVPDNAPDVLYYVSESAIDTGGVIKIYDITENTYLDVGSDILGKKTYTAANKVAFSNGMKVRFTGKVTPEKYSTGYWYIEGVGDTIKLVSERDLEIIGPYTAERSVLFDDEKFDKAPFSATSYYAKDKDYFVINRGSLDRNPWSRYNRWFHKDIIETAFAVNGAPVELDQTSRATRPIIEFEPGLKLFNFGYQAKQNVDLVDTFTTDVFSTIEGAIGYNIDGIDLASSMRVLFTADTDSFVKNKIFVVNFIDVDNPSRQIEFAPTLNYDYILQQFNFDTPHSLSNGNQLVYLNNNNDNIPGFENRNAYFVKVIGPNSIELYTTNTFSVKVTIAEGAHSIHKFEVYAGSKRQIMLTEADDALPQDQETLLSNFGKDSQGQMYWYDSSEDLWRKGQVKYSVNQPPLFDIVDENGDSYGDKTIYDGSTFSGTKVFSYAVGTGRNDAELGFPLAYQNINNVGDIKFSFDLLMDKFEYKESTIVKSRNTDIGYLKIVNDIKEFRFENGWTKSSIVNTQPIVRVFKESGLVNNFPVDVFDDVGNLSDLRIKVYVNGVRLYDTDFTIQETVVRKVVVLNTDITTTDIVTLECFARQAKNENGYYKIPINLQQNPLNNNLTSFTLGQVIDHVGSIVSNMPKFNGMYPGISNIRDSGYISSLGTKFVQHSGPLNLSLYHFGSKSSNALAALERARDEYGKFKRAFIVAASSSGIDAEPRLHVDYILAQMAANRPKTQPYYLSDMFAYTGATRSEFIVQDADAKIYPLITKFNLTALSNRAVSMYLNGEQLLHGRDYEFGDDVFFTVLVDLTEDDILEVFEYASTDGSFCPPTPTKLGLYPAFEPVKFVDETYLEPTQVIQGHDGSITVAFNDYRDDLILELETRIFNNIKVKYDPTMFDIYDFIPGYSRVTDYSKDEFEAILAPAFYSWTANINQDFTQQRGFDRLNPYTFNYRGNYSPDGKDVPAYWRGIYNWVLDTDHPHIHPWECLGFSIEPKWWREVYGPAPYTSNNNILWEDIYTGTIREPGKPVRKNEKFAKAILDAGLPVDESGALINPLYANYAAGYIKSTPEGYYVFGDQGPVETAWRRSSYYPFAVIQAALLMSPSKVLGTCLDRSRIVRNRNNQIVYAPTNLRVRLKDMVLPSTVNSTERVFTSGLINYIVDYVIGDISASVSDYKENLETLTNKIGSKLGGFTSKPKYKLLLDSKNPTATGGVFVPEENYQIVLNTSSPIRKVVYSGVIITKFPDGFEIRGYNVDSPYFNYYPWNQNDRIVKVGGISESFVEWETNQFYVLGKIVRANGQYWRVKTTHTSGENFDSGYFTKLPELPIVGGREAMFRKSWNTDVTLTLGYATKLLTIQNVVDFLLGYGAYLKNQGFIFDNFNTEMSVVTDWETSAKEFMFWTTQNWAEGAVISLSPAAEQLVLATGQSVVQNIIDPFYQYKIFRVDGKTLEPEYTDVFRADTQFGLSVNGTYGIYGATLYLVQKEHILILDNKTLFNDIIYDLEPGYKQDRLKVLGYISSNWTGGFNVPGFIFDEARTQSWEPWTDFSLGDIVKYKEFYYSAKTFLPGTTEFESENWVLLTEKPEPQLLPNWDYKADQFNDFYDLDTDNFDAEQQRLAQHLIGYQKRQYLANIINDDVSQYKFYQGMIIEKGTQNVLTKLFDVLSADGEESLVFNEEWAVRVGTYGATHAYEEVEFTLDESNFKVNPQPLELVRSIDPNTVDFVYRMLPSQIYVKPVGNINPWPVESATNYLRSPGFVRYEDVKLYLDELDEILNYTVSDFVEGDYVWCAFERNDWNIYRFTHTHFKVETATYSGTTLVVTADRIPKIKAGDIIGFDHTSSMNGFFKVNKVVNREIHVTADISGWADPFAHTGVLSYTFSVCRSAHVDDANNIIPRKMKTGELLWVDNDGTGEWKVLEHTKIYESSDSIDDPINAVPGLNFGQSVSINESGSLAVVTDNDQISVFEKTTLTTWAKTRVIFPDLEVSDEPYTFGSVTHITSDTAWLVVASPTASHVKVTDDVFGIDVSGAGMYVSPYANQGYVNLYKRSSYTGIFRLYGALVSSGNNDPATFDSLSENERFGASVSSSKSGGNYMMAISAPGYNDDAGKVTLVRVSGTSWNYYGIELGKDPSQWQPSSNVRDGLGKVIHTGDEFGYCVSFSKFGEVLAISAPGNNDSRGAVHIYKNQNNNYVKVFTIDSSFAGLNLQELDRFGQSVDVNSTGTQLVVGAPNTDSRYNDQGTVFVFDVLATGECVLIQTIRSTRIEPGEKFGAMTKFASNGATLAVLAEMGDVLAETTFDLYSTQVSDYRLQNNELSQYVNDPTSTLTGATTTFDNGSFRIVDSFTDTGRVDIYEKYHTKFIFSGSLDTDVTSISSDKYGTSLAVSNTSILVSAPNDSDVWVSAGSVYTYTKPLTATSWKVKHYNRPRTNISRMKKAYLYNKVTNSLITYLDIIDPIQGKIAGLAEQELKFKTYFDPAVYSIGTGDVTVDDGMNWTKAQVGMLWWDLTRAKFLENQGGETIFRSTSWNKLYSTASIDVYEWVETKYKPSDWDKLADTEKGLSQGISGQSRYGDKSYSVKRRYDTVSKQFIDTYYFWVKNKTTIPQVIGRTLSARNVADLIADPIGYGYPCIGFLGSSGFTLANVDRYLEDDKIALNIQYWVIDQKTINAHSQWKLISENTNTIIPRSVEAKWIDSLVGKDEKGRLVPDPNLPIKQRYGIENRPRQGMFVNRIEAVKQYIERANIALSKKLIVDDVDLTELKQSDPRPSSVSGRWDTAVDTEAELRFVGTATVVTAQFTPVISDGKIIAVNITNPGHGYVNAPYIKVVGIGSGAKLQTVLDEFGRVVEVLVLETGNNYSSDTFLSVRSFAVLVLSDSTSYDKWSIYSWNKQGMKWEKQSSQAFDVTKFWRYKDWYATGYNQFVKIDHVVENTYQLVMLPSNIGDIIKVNNIGSGGWVLLEKYNNNFTIDYTENFKVVARESGTIEFSESLYMFKASTLGFDGPLFDGDTYDNYPSTELRIILNMIKDKLFVDDLYVEYLKLFFASVRYILKEQTLVDWVFKTSMVKARHNVGALQQKVTYNSDNLDSFEDYINEVKPYRTKIREYVSTYSNVEQSQSVVSDFDLLPVVGLDYAVTPMQVKVDEEGTITASAAEINYYPWKHWLDNVGFTVTEIHLVDGGSGYLNNPVVKITGGFGSGATAKAYIANGSVNRIELITSGTGYLKAPIIEFMGGTSVDGVSAKAIAVIESEVVRSNKISIKFDRLSKNYYVSELTKTETFVGTGSRVQFPLEFSPRTAHSKSTVTAGGLEVLRGDYSLSSKTTIVNGTTVYSGLLIFETPPEADAMIEIEYEKDFNHMSAVDRINFFYNPESGMLGKDLAQLMTGVDYGGVIISGLGFGLAGGFDAQPWFSDAWDSFDVDFDDYMVSVGTSGRTFDLPYVPATGELINVYLNGVRIDGADKEMETIVGGTPSDVFDGIQTITISAEVTLVAGDKIIFRKSTSDGSQLPDALDYDTQLSGGAFVGTAMSSATGLAPDDIVLDGDGFVTPMTSHAPEEVVPGQILDAVAIKVFHRPIASSPKILFKNYISNGTDATYKIGQQLPTARSVIVKVADRILETDEYTIDWPANTITLDTVAPAGTIVSVASFGYNSSTLLDFDYFIADGFTNEFVTKAPWLSSGLNSTVLVNGEAIDYVLFMTDESYVSPDLVGIRFANVIPEGAIVNYMIDTQEGSTIVHQHASIVKSQELMMDGTSSTYVLENLTAEALAATGLHPYEVNVIVRKDQEILTPSTVFYFTMANDNLVYTVPSYRFTEYSVDAANIRIFVDGTPLSPVTDYVVDLFGITVTLAELAYVEGSQLSVVFDIGHDYMINNDGTITFMNQYSAGTIIEVISFYNHSTLNVNRTNDSLIPKVAVEPGSVDYYEFTGKVGGNFTLTRPAASDDYVWVVKNKQLLTHSIDYVLDSDHITVRLKTPLAKTDTIQIILFGNEPVGGSFGYMQFKDMLNRVHYKRINKDKSTRLVRDLLQRDSKIYVEDGSRLSTPLRDANVPGIIEINGERIEYFAKDGNVLSQLRRATLGTGAPERHRMGLFVVDFGATETIPYVDQQIVATGVSDGVTTEFVVDYVPTVSANAPWFRDTIPETHHQNNEVDVFVGGYRLKKVPFERFEESNNSPYSPEGDTKFEAEFSVDGQTNYVRLTNVALENTKVMIVKKVGKTWSDPGKALTESNTAAANFIKNTDTIWPQYLVDKYQYVLDTDDGLTLATDDDIPLELD